MSKKLDQRLLDILLKYDEKPEAALWDCHGTWVAYHKAIERIAAKAGVVYEAPNILVAERDAAAVLVTGKLGEKKEWSIGEAAIGLNYRVKERQPGYPFAMAEKRAKDRVVLKLIGLHGEVYSEEEADDFKEKTASPPSKSSAALKRTDENGDDAWDRLTKKLDRDLVDCRSITALSKLRADYREEAKAQRWNGAWLEALADKFDGHEEALKAQANGHSSNEYLNNMSAG